MPGCLGARAPSLQAELALVLAAVSLGDRTSGTAWAIVGLVVGTVAVAFTVSGIPVGLMSNPLIQPEIS